MASTLRTPPRFVPTLTTVLEIRRSPRSPSRRPHRRPSPTRRVPWHCRRPRSFRRRKSSASKSSCCTAFCSASTLSLEERLSDTVSAAVQHQLDAMVPRLRNEIEAVLRALVIEAMAAELSENTGFTPASGPESSAKLRRRSEGREGAAGPRRETCEVSAPGSHDRFFILFHPSSGGSHAIEMDWRSHWLPNHARGFCGKKEEAAAPAAAPAPTAAAPAAPAPAPAGETLVVKIVVTRTDQWCHRPFPASDNEFGAKMAIEDLKCKGPQDRRQGCQVRTDRRRRRRRSEAGHGCGPEARGRKGQRRGRSPELGHHHPRLEALQ